MIRPLAIAILVTAVASTPLRAQETRAELLRQATVAADDFNAARALVLARAALDPALGAPDTAWVRGVHLVAQLLVEGGEEGLAATWARWATRLNPSMPIDSVNFVAGVVAVLRDARRVASVRSSGDDVTRTAWAWAARGSTETQGRIRFDPSTMPVPVNVLVRGVGLLPAGPTGLGVAPGSYDIEVGAPGYLPARVTREVLPGVTVILSFQLTSAAIASETIAEGVRQSVYRGTAALSVARFGSPPACAAGAFAGGRFVLTSYAAIRGANNLTATLAGGASAGEGIRVAAYDATSNLAVLQFPTARPDSVPLAATVTDGQAVWGVGLAQCRTLSDSRAVVSEWIQRPLGALRLSDAIAQAVPGSPLVDYQGRLVGIWTAATAAIPAPTAAALLDLARRNVAAQQTLALAEVARRENHAYGTIVVAATDMTGVTARFTPLEPWHWPELAASGPAPFTFSGPSGRYRLEVTAAGITPRTQEVVIRAGETIRLPLSLSAVAGGGGAQPPAVKKGGIPKWVWFAGGGVAVAAAALGGGGGSTPKTGIINISVPNP